MTYILAIIVSILLWTTIGGSILAYRIKRNLPLSVAATFWLAGPMGWLFMWLMEQQWGDDE